MLVRRAYEIQINRNHDLHGWCLDMCSKARILRNKITYIRRQEIFDNKKFLTNTEIYKKIKDQSEWSLFGHTQIAKNIWKSSNQEWSSYSRAIKEYRKNPSKFKGQPKFPKYSKYFYKIGLHVGQNNSPCMHKNGKLRFLGSNKKEYKIFEISGEVKEISIVPRGDDFSIFINYNKEINTKINDKKRIASIDLGLNNLCAITNNTGLQPTLINGRHLKSINQYWNKKVSVLKEQLPENQYSSRKISNITRKRNNKINNELHTITNSIVDYIKINDIGTLVIGKNDFWKQNIKIGKRNNQNFVQIPYSKLINHLIYKLEGTCEIIQSEESYTSKASFLDMDNIPVYSSEDHKPNKFSGKRIKRGLYKSKTGMLINADINASYNILRKVIPNVFDHGIEAVVVQPVLLDRSNSI